jgi:hypothetical protein
MADQTTFGAALLDPETPPPPGLTDGEGRPAGRRFNVYRNNVAVSLTDALATGFPVIAKLLGEEFFNAMAGIFLRAHPPGDPRLQLWGGKFPGFLARFEPVAHLPYLPDMARLELGLRQSYHAADVAPLPIAGRDPAEVLALKPRMAPATMILRSRFPILTIWQKNTTRPDLTIDWHPEAVLITRPQFDPQVQALPDGGHTLARHLKGRMSLADAVTATQTLDPDVDASALLTLFLSSGALTLDAPATT